MKKYSGFEKFMIILSGILGFLAGLFGSIIPAVILLSIIAELFQLSAETVLNYLPIIPLLSGIIGAVLLVRRRIKKYRNWAALANLTTFNTMHNPADELKYCYIHINRWEYMLIHKEDAFEVIHEVTPNDDGYGTNVHLSLPLDYFETHSLKKFYDSFRKKHIMPAPTSYNEVAELNELARSLQALGIPYTDPESPAVNPSLPVLTPATSAPEKPTTQKPVTAETVKPPVEKPVTAQPAKPPVEKPTTADTTTEEKIDAAAEARKMRNEFEDAIRIGNLPSPATTSRTIVLSPTTGRLAIANASMHTYYDRCYGTGSEIHFVTDSYDSVSYKRLQEYIWQGYVGRFFLGLNGDNYRDYLDDSIYDENHAFSQLKPCYTLNGYRVPQAVPHLASLMVSLRGTTYMLTWREYALEIWHYGTGGRLKSYPLTYFSNHTLAEFYGEFSGHEKEDPMELYELASCLFSLGVELDPQDQSTYLQQNSDARLCNPFAQFNPFGDEIVLGSSDHLVDQAEVSVILDATYKALYVRVQYLQPTKQFTSYTMPLSFDKIDTLISMKLIPAKYRGMTHDLVEKYLDPALLSEYASEPVTPDLAYYIKGKGTIDSRVCYLGQADGDWYALCSENIKPYKLPSPGKCASILTDSCGKDSPAEFTIDQIYGKRLAADEAQAILECVPIFYKDNVGQYAAAAQHNHTIALFVIDDIRIPCAKRPGLSTLSKRIYDLFEFNFLLRKFKSNE